MTASSEHEHGHEESSGPAGQHHAECTGMLQTPEHFRMAAQQAAHRLKIRFPMLIDPDGRIGARFTANDLPLYVLLDAQGMIRRRLVGFRTESALAAMIGRLSAKRLTGNERIPTLPPLL